MDNWGASDGRRLVRLTRQECLALLGSRSLARVAFCTPAGPQVLPVNYALQDGAPLFRTSSHGSLAEGLHDGAAAALQVDQLVEGTRSGWSVLLRGHAAVVEHSSLPATSSARPHPWAGGARMLHLRIVPTEITGRRLEPSEDLSHGRSWLRS